MVLFQEKLIAIHSWGVIKSSLLGSLGSRHQDKVSFQLQARN
jgi:hypothetical protein